MTKKNRNQGQKDKKTETSIPHNCIVAELVQVLGDIGLAIRTALVEPEGEQTNITYPYPMVGIALYSSQDNVCAVWRFMRMLGIYNDVCYRECGVHWLLVPLGENLMALRPEASRSCEELNMSYHVPQLTNTLRVMNGWYHPENDPEYVKSKLQG